MNFRSEADVCIYFMTFVMISNMADNMKVVITMRVNISNLQFILHRDDIWYLFQTENFIKPFYDIMLHNALFTICQICKVSLIWFIGEQIVFLIIWYNHLYIFLVSTLKKLTLYLEKLLSWLNFLIRREYTHGQLTLRIF